MLRRLISGTPFLILIGGFGLGGLFGGFLGIRFGGRTLVGVIANCLRVDHLTGLLLVDLMAVLGYRVLRIVDTCLRNARLEAVLRVFGQVG